MNEQVRKNIYFSQLKYWEVAEQIGISNSQLSVWLRTPLNDERKARVEKAINELTQKAEK